MIIIKPVLSEKSAVHMQDGLYVFEVAHRATKSAIAEEVQKTWGVKVKSVRIVNLPPKKVTFRRIKGVRSKRRRAYIQLADKARLRGFELPKQTTKEK